MFKCVKCTFETASGTRSVKHERENPGHYTSYVSPLGESYGKMLDARADASLPQVELHDKVFVIWDETQPGARYLVDIGSTPEIADRLARTECERLADLGNRATMHGTACRDRYWQYTGEARGGHVVSIVVRPFVIKRS